MAESVQKKLLRVRPPRVKITYDVETGGAIEARELPFIVGIFADLSSDKPAIEKPALKERKFLEIDNAIFDDVMASISPGIELYYVGELLDHADTGASGDAAPASGDATAASEPKKHKAALVFKQLDDFLPTQIVRRFEPLNAIFQARLALRDIQSQLEASEELEILLQETVEDSDRGNSLREAFSKAYPPGNAPKPEDEPKLEAVLTGDLAALVPEHLKALEGDRLVAFNRTMREVTAQLKDLVAHRAKGPAVISKLIDTAVADHDKRLGFVLDQVLHAPEFQKLEATWRGLHYLVSKSETGQMLKLRVLNLTRDELATELAKAVEFDQSHIFKLIYEHEYGTLGGHPYSMLMGDYSFGRDHASMALLADIAQVAAAAHTPFIAAVSPDMFGIKEFEYLAKPRDLAQIFESPELNEWQAFRDSEDSRYVTLVLPRVLLRLPHASQAQGNQMVTFTERVQPEVTLPDGAVDDTLPGIVDDSRCLWGNAAYVLTERITNAFTLYRWTAAIRGVEGGGLVEGLPNYTFTSPSGEISLLCPTQVTITDRREMELNKLGFIALCHRKGTNTAVFFGGQTANRPKVYLVDAATANAALSSRLPYMMAASRFAHYVKVIMRDKIGSFQTAAQVANYLNTWITQYVLLDDNAGQEAKAAYPLREARVEVTEVPGQPGSYNATMFLRPHFQLEELTASIRLVAKLPG